MSVSERVPWISKDEWEHCRDNLFGSDVLMKQKALEHLYIWKVRGPSLPIAVECTLILMDVHLKGCDRNSENEFMFSNTMNYESWYSVAIMRFLNLIMDSNVGNKTSSSMNQLARQYKIPEWIVEIRHAVAHGPLLPSLSYLKEAVEKCLDWLNESYWKTNIYEDWIQKCDKINSSSTFHCFEILLRLKKYLSFGFENISDIAVEDRQKVNNVLSKTSEEEVNYMNEWTLLEIYKRVLKKLGRHLRKDTDYAKSFVSSILKTDEYLLARNAMKNNELSKTFLDNWNDILVVICDSGICSYFLQELARTVISPIESSRRQHCAALLLNEILQNIIKWKRQNSSIENAENTSIKPKKLKKKSGNNSKTGQDSVDQTSPLIAVKLTEEDIQNILCTVSDEPNQFVGIFLENLLKISDLRNYRTKYEKLISLINIYSGKQFDSDNSMEVDDDTWTVQKLVGNSELFSHVIDEEKSNQILNNHYEKTEISSVECNEWENTPLGILPWQTGFQPWLYIYNSE